MGKVKGTAPDKIICKKVIMIEPGEWAKSGNYYTKEVLISGADESPVYATIQVGRRECKDAKIFEH